MSEISGRIGEVTELATDWAQNSELSASQRLTNEITAISERFGSVSTRLIKKEKELEDILAKWQSLESSCSDLLAWIENQNDVLNETVTVDAPLTVQLQQLATCQVKPCFLLYIQSRPSRLSLFPKTRRRRFRKPPTQTFIGFSCHALLPWGVRDVTTQRTSVWETKVSLIIWDCLEQTGILRFKWEGSHKSIFWLFTLREDKYRAEIQKENSVLFPGEG